MAHRPKPLRPVLLLLAGLIAPILLRVIGSTWRFRIIGSWRHRRARRDGQKVIMACWHQAQLPFIYTHRGQGIRVLVSYHADGELLARLLEGLGYRTVRGSTTRGGASALKGLVRLARAGHDLAITPDGPRGPRYKVQPGVITLARLTGLPILRGAWAASRVWEFRSWDRFRIPKPFARIVAIHGGPYRVPRDLSEEEEEACRQELEKDLRAETDRAQEALRGGLAVPGA